MAVTMKQLILQLLIFVAIISYAEAEVFSVEKHVKHKFIAQVSRPRRQTSGNSGFSNTFAEPAQQNSGQSRPSNESKRSTSQPQTTSTSSSTDSEARITQCIRNCRFVNFADYVCASDGVTYMNEPHFNCAVKCGRRITIQYRAACAPPSVGEQISTEKNQSTTNTTSQPQVSNTTNSAASDARITQCIRNCRFVNFADYVCGSDGVTYMNEPHFNCAVKCGRKITIQYRAACA